MRYRTFETTVSKPESGLPFFSVPPDVVDWLKGATQPLPVCGVAAGLAYRGVMWPDHERDGAWFVDLSPELVASGRFENGKQIEVTIAFDEEPREAGIPYELTETLGMAALAERAWDKLSESERTPYCEWVAAAADPHQRWERAERAAVLVRRGEKLEMTSHSQGE